MRSTFSRSILAVGLLLCGGAAVAQVDSSIVVAPDTGSMNQARTPVFTITSDDLDSEVGQQDVSGILQSSRDVFTSTAGFNFGLARFRIRGLDPENTLVSINGVLVNDLESGWATWSNWAGLNDVTRWMTVRSGINPSRYNFGGIAGYNEISLRASELRKGVRVSYASSDRVYRNRVMATYNTGLMSNGWAFSASASTRWAEEGYVAGTYFRAAAYFLGAEKKINDKHSLGFSAFGAPIEQGRQILGYEELYGLTGDNFYNPAWGYQAGVKRNSRVSIDHKPTFLLTHYWTPDERTQVNTSAIYSFGRDSQTNLNWYDAENPKPDYYRYLPSYWAQLDPNYASQLAAAWQTDPNTQQINWDQLYFANGKNLFTLQNAEGIQGNDLTGMRSKYIVEEMHTDPTRLGINSVWSRDLDDTRHLTVGGSYNKQVTHNFKVLNDLLGGEYWVDIDQFADRDFNDTTLSQNDLNNPNNAVYQGDRFGYDYDIHVRHLNVFGQYELKGAKVEGYVGASISSTGFFRDGKYVNGRFPEESFGKSDELTFFNMGVKAGMVYKLSGRHYLTANAAALTRPPTARTAYISPRTRDAVVEGIQDEKVFSGDLSYVVRMARLKGRATVYYAQVNDQLWSRNYYHDDFNTIVNYTMNNVDQQHFGTEIGVEGNLSSTWVATAVYAGGNYFYDSRPTATITRDNSSEIFDQRTVYWQNYRVGGVPQTAASLGLKYNSPKYWFVGVNANWFDDIYLDPNPDRRTSEALEGLVTEDPQWAELLTQTKLDPGGTIDLYGGKSWMFKRKYRLAINATISNLLNNTDLQIGGYEQLRFDPREVGKFPNRIGYMFGRTYFAMITFSF
ncbi:MAG: TonB-dependent receptor plug domain-containing protein [Flavobacteriales bacterium]|nr:TonB-dependent receptor plug domain-containing protein [Flavobacteriales bacterium]